jgi:hypothetical protein
MIEKRAKWLGDIEDSPRFGRMKMRGIQEYSKSGLTRLIEYVVDFPRSRAMAAIML